MTPASEERADEASPAERRDQGLVQGVGAWGLGVAVFNNVVGAGIFALPAALAREIGAAAPFAYLAVGLATAAVAVCFAAAGSRVPTSGGAYGYAEAAFGPYAGFLIGVLIWLGCVLGAAGIAAAIADNLARLLPALAAPLGRAAVIGVLFAALAAVNVRGVQRGTGLVGLLTLAKLGPIAVLLVVGAAHVKAANLAPAAPDPSAFGRAMLLAAFAFQGMEGALGVSGEVRRPARNIPRGLLGAMAFIAVLYMAIQTVTQGVLGPALARSASPLADALAGVSPALFTLMIVGATLSQLGYMAGDTLTAPRMIFAFARDGYLPGWAGALHPKSRAPYAAILIHVAVGAALAVSGTFGELAVLSALATVGVYVVSCAAAVVLQRRGVAHAGPPLTLSWLWLAALAGAAGMLWIGAHATHAEFAGCLATLVAASLWYLVVRRTRPRTRG